MSQNLVPWASAGTGLSTPQFFDGQVLAAADLSLGQSARDAELARMRVLLHGWGVVAGLVPGVSGGRLLINPGYGVLPGGRELYLPEALDITVPTGQELAAHCGARADSCELPSTAEGPDGRGTGDESPTPTVWLAVGAVRQAAAPRTAAATGCTHPGNTAQPTRWCHQVALYLLCELPENHQLGEESCAELGGYICDSPMAPVQLPDPDPGPDVLVLGRLTGAHGDSEAYVDFEGRRPLLPNHVLQSWLRSCLCPVLNDRRTEQMDWGKLRQRMLELGLDQREERSRPGSVFKLYESVEEGLSSPVDRLIGAGILGPAMFLSTLQRVLSTVTGIEAKQLRQTLRELAAIRTEVGF